MIRINLLGEKVDTLREYVAQLLIFGLALLVAVLICGFGQIYLNARRSGLEDEQQDLQVKLTKLKQVTRKVEGLEKKQKLLKEKLKTIATLKAKKQGPVRVLDELNRRIPERAWLTAVVEHSGKLQLDGVALDDQTVAAFMSTLQKSDFVKEVNLIHSTQQVVKELKLKQFSMSVDLRDALEAQQLASGQAPAVPEVKTKGSRR